MKFKRKVVALCLAFAMVMSLLLTNVSAKNGDVIGYTRYTDIVAYINHYAIQSYNYKDYTYVVAEDLQNYGFNVVWDGEARTLNITRNTAVNTVAENKTISATPIEKVSKIALDVLETDICTYINGVLIESYNVDGKTIIQFDSLGAFGSVNWLDDLRVIKLWVEDGLEMRSSMQQLAIIKENYKDNQNDKFFAEARSYIESEQGFDLEMFEGELIRIAQDMNKYYYYWSAGGGFGVFAQSVEDSSVLSTVERNIGSVLQAIWKNGNQQYLFFDSLTLPDGNKITYLKDSEYGTLSSTRVTFVQNGQSIDYLCADTDFSTVVYILNGNKAVMIDEQF